MQLFSRRGFTGTCTRDIARLADVSEACLFRYFSRKHDLFWAAVQSRIDRLSVRNELQLGLRETAQPESVLPLIVEMLVQMMVYQPELLPLLYFAGMEMRRGAERICRRKFGPLLKAVVHYLKVSAEAGKLHTTDPAFAATAFVSSVLAHQSLSSLFTGTAAPYRDAKQMVAAYSNFWVDLLVPKLNPTAGPKRVSAA